MGVGTLETRHCGSWVSAFSPPSTTTPSTTTPTLTPVDFFHAEILGIRNLFGEQVQGCGASLRHLCSHTPFLGSQPSLMPIHRPAKALAQLTAEDSQGGVRKAEHLPRKLPFMAAHMFPGGPGREWLVWANTVPCDTKALKRGGEGSAFQEQSYVGPPLGKGSHTCWHLSLPQSLLRTHSAIWALPSL